MKPKDAVDKINELIQDRAHAIKFKKDAEDLLSLINDGHRAFFSSNASSNININCRMKNFVIDALKSEIEYQDKFQSDINKKLESIALLMGITE